MADTGDDAVYFQFVGPGFEGFETPRPYWSKLLVVRGLVRDDEWKEGPEGPITRITQATYDQIKSRFQQALQVGQEALDEGVTFDREERTTLEMWLATVRIRCWMPKRQQLIRVRAPRG